MIEVAVLSMRSKRIQQLHDYIAGHGTVSFGEICRQFGISINTARRDVAALLEEGDIVKVYGGVQYVEKTGLLPFEDRDAAHHDEKHRICALAAGFIGEGEVVFLDSGTTVPGILDFVGDKHFTVITSSLPVLLKASQLPGVSVYTLPGLLNRQTYSFEQNLPFPILDQYNINKAFMAASGVTISGGVTNSSPWEFQLKASIVAKNIDSFLLADHSKFGRVTLLKYAELADFRNVVTAGPLPDKYRTYLSHHNIRLHTAD